ncbi:hypothetical protein IC229_29645, partial [Spirosoma sp. BT702]
MKQILQIVCLICLFFSADANPAKPIKANPIKTSKGSRSLSGRLSALAHRLQNAVRVHDEPQSLWKSTRFALGDHIDDPRSLSAIAPLPFPKPLPIKKPLGPDPIRFLMQANKASIAIGEEVEITITAELMPILPSQMFFFEAQRSYRLKVLLPKNFVQTGGTYYDYVGGSLSTNGNKKEQYTIKGYFIEAIVEPFILLRGGKDPGVSDLFEKKQQLFIQLATKDPITQPRARQTAACLLKTMPVGVSYKTKTTTVKGQPKVDSSFIILRIPDSARYEFSRDSIQFQNSPQVFLPDTAGSIIIRDKVDKTCTIKIKYHYKKPSNSTTNIFTPCGEAHLESETPLLCDDSEGGNTAGIVELKNCTGGSTRWAINGQYDNTYDNSINIQNAHLGKIYSATCVCNGVDYPLDDYAFSEDPQCGCIPSWVNVSPAVTQCNGNDRERKQVDGCGNERWVLDQQNACGCKPQVWTDANPAVTQCNGNDRERKQVDGCGNERWVLDQQNACGCKPQVWTDANPAVTQCNGNDRERKQVDGCGNERWVLDQQNACGCKPQVWT